MNITVITPPLVQLNSPYPSGAYLTSFFKNLGHDCRWKDLSIALVYELFSKEGLSRLFELSHESALRLADKAQTDGDENTAFNIRRYLSTKDNWIKWIDDILLILCGKGREKEHQFLFSPFAPRGARMETFLAGLEREPSVDDVRFLASYALADLADYITAVFDSEFSLIRYAEHLTVDERAFAQIEKELESPVMKYFYQKVLEKNFDKEDCPDMVCISIPFAGTFLPALYTARYFKQRFGDKVFVVIGGGFVNTELRDVSEAALGKYINAISYDRGYGSYKSLFDRLGPGQNKISLNSLTRQSFYKLRVFTPDSIQPPLFEDKEMEAYESKLTAQVIPDYSDIDFSIYPRVCDDKNPMHRLWNDGAWIKAYLAHGCYWHKCAFCDTQLDYVCGYRPVDVEKLYQGLLKTAREQGIYGIHFVDEALPPRFLKAFALLNARHGNPLYFWGNVRFEKAYDKDLAALLSYCGFGGASAGLEVATGVGLKAINKGVDIDSIISACAAFKEAGILVHAYMIYGFWYDDAQSIINSMETLRQFFQAGLLDSSFWHKFVLTRNSQVFYEWTQGKHPELNPVIPKTSKSIFADNNLHFKGEDKYDKFGLPLENALAAWMHGERLEMKVQKWFDFPVPAPTIPKDFIEKGIERYENRNIQKLDFSGKKEIYWLGSEITSNTWLYLQEEYSKKMSSALVQLLTSLKPSSSEQKRLEAMETIKKSPDLQKQIQGLHNIGLVLA